MRGALVARSESVLRGTVMTSIPRWLVAVSTLMSMTSYCQISAGADGAPVDFNRTIRPILSSTCFRCHGPDAEERKAGLRLDEKEGAYARLESGESAIVPGQLDQSELIRRIFSTDDSERMPPPDSHKQLNEAEKQALKTWVAEGAVYRDHWSFRSVVRPPLPTVSNTKWVRNPIDNFVLAKLEATGLVPSPEADKTTLVRRVYLDLTGLPPTPQEIDAFLEDQDPNAYENLIDRLMSTPQYAERMTVDWLDASRFADTNGYHIDNGRDMSRWRDWVISSFASNQPYDQFTIEQLAGDLLPQPTIQQRIASGFNRNHMTNFEGGAIPEEYHTAYIIDRVNTTSTVFMGLTVACAQCHDHKYDPITQKEFYQLFAFFYNVPENGLDGGSGNSVPLIAAPTPIQEVRLKELTTQLAELEQRFSSPDEELDSELAKWETQRSQSGEVAWQIRDPIEFRTSVGAIATKDVERSWLLTGPNAAQETYTVRLPSDLNVVSGIRIEVLPHESLPARGPGRSPNGNFVMTEASLLFKTNAGPAQKIALESATADFSQETYPARNVIDGKSNTGWAIYPETGKPHSLILSVNQPVNVVDKSELILSLEFHSQFGQHQPGRLRFAITNSPDPKGIAAIPENIVQILSLPAADRSPDQKTALRVYYRSNHSIRGKQWNAEITQIRKVRQELEKSIPTAMVMQEMAQPRTTRVLIRGQYDKKGEIVQANVPSNLPPLPENAPKNRLGLANWLVSPNHPLTSRVTVNRYWQLLFGTGIVKSSDDFGSQGELPSHPDLLDWLAAEFMQPVHQQQRHPWDLRGLLKLMLTSSTYRQSSILPSSLLQADPENRMLARGARHRLQIEFIRDQALFVSGLLDRRVGGPSVSPYQPSGLWEELMSRADGKNWTAQEYVQSHGADLYRRTMYTFWKRTCPPASLSTFDAPDRETCTVRRARTNTPLQALVLLNDPTYVEASRKLAERVLVEGGKSMESRLEFLFRTVTGRLPKPQEKTVLARIHLQQLAQFQKDPVAVEKLLQVGESSINKDLDQPELATWTTLSSIMLNLDETVTKS